MRTLRFAVCSLLAAFVPAQEQGEVVVQVTVTAVSERSVFLDRGRESGLRVGTIVQLFPPGTGGIDVEVRSVSGTSARAELPPDLPPPPVGTRGEARVPRDASQAPAPARPLQPQAPVHPPWVRREDARAPDQPLLVPTYGQRPDERPTTFDGRAFAYGQWNRDSGADRDATYTLARLGLRADATNYLGDGERVRFAGELSDRRVDVPDEPDQTDQTARLDLLSVAFGTEHWAPTGIEGGRFYSPHLPEIGLVDGLEVVRRYEGGLRFGGGLGSYPRPFPARDAGEDLGVHAFVDWTADDNRTFAAGLGVQKTWHEGDADRDLLLLRAEGTVWERVRIYGSAKVDYYTSSDTIKGSGLELTELLAAASWDTTDGGLGMNVSHFTWPELKRAEYQDLPPSLVSDGEVNRAGGRAWLRPARWLRLQGRADVWRDQDRDGTAFGLDTDARVGARTNLAVSVFQNDGGYTSGPGARAVLRAPLGDGYWRAGYRWYRYDLTDLVTGSETYSRQSAELGGALPLSDSCDLDASLEHWFGDREDAWSFGLFVQWRF